MTRALSHRGPDGNGVVKYPGGAVLGHTRLSILDLSHAADQPMQTVSGNCAIVFNGEIYNHADLRRILEAEGARIRSSGDTEVLLRWVDRSWSSQLDALDGMFAFAAFDLRERRLLLVRDRLGKKPIFLVREPGALLFASELAARGAAGVSLEADSEQLGHFLVRGYVPPPSTLCRVVQQLEPGEALECDGQGRERKLRYWTHPWLRQSCTISRETSVDRATETIRQLFRQAVQRRLASDVPLGAFLSGGVDSAAVVAVAQELLGRPLQTVTIGFEGAPGWDEARAARETADYLKAQHTDRSLSPDSLDVLSRVLELTAEPQGDSSLIPTYLVSGLARQQVKVVLTGDGGDELFAGYDRFLVALGASMTGPALAGPLNRWLKTRPEGPRTGGVLRRLRRWSRAACLGPAASLMEWSGGARIEQAEALLGRSVDPEQLSQPESAVYQAARRNGAGRLQGLLAANILTYLPGDILTKVDRASMAHGLEARSPLLDIPLLEYCVSLAPWLLARGTKLKWIFKRAMSQWVPDFVMQRRKRGFGAPVGIWFRGPQGEAALALLQERTSPLRDYADSKAVGRLAAEHRNGADDHGMVLWRLLVLNHWLRLTGSPVRRPIRSESQVLVAPA
jgi:asparagine synthase (glutamine-hydrolysing)